MRTVQEFFTSNKSGLVLPLITSFLILASPFTILQIPRPLAQSLPKQIGRLNDYGNILTMGDQRDLEEKIKQLGEEGIGLTILISNYDPFSEPSIYANEIRNEWGIRGEEKESLIVFVRDEDEDWSVRTFLRPVVTNLFSSGELAEYQDSIKAMTEDGDIRDATREAVLRIYREAFPPKVDPENESTRNSNGLLIYIIAGASGGVVLVVLFLRWEGRRRCPRCGARLETSSYQDDLSGSTTERHCPACGYHERD